MQRLYSVYAQHTCSALHISVRVKTLFIDFNTVRSNKCPRYGSHLKALNETNPMVPISSHPHTHTHPHTTHTPTPSHNTHPHTSQVLIHRSASEEGVFLSVTDDLFNHDLFLLSWGPTVAALYPLCLIMLRPGES